MEGELNSELADVIVQRRALFEEAYIQLRQAHPYYIMQPFNLIVHNTSQLLDRVGWNAGNELYCSALHLTRPYQVRRVGNTKVFFPLLCNNPATIANKNELFCDTNLLD